MANECHFIRNSRFIEASFGPDDLASKDSGTLCVQSLAGPRVLLSTIEAGNLRFHDSLPNPSRQHFLQGLGIAENRMLAIKLAHSRRVLLVEDKIDALELAGKAQACGGVDGIITTDPRFIPSVTVADCMPIWLWVEGSTIFGVLHSGWRGTGIFATAIEILKTRLGVLPGKVHAILGPAIGQCCYSVDEKRAHDFATEFGNSCVSERKGTWYMDLRKANESIADSLGLGSVENMTICTQCDTSMGSSRRQGQDHFTPMLALCGFF